MPNDNPNMPNDPDSAQSMANMFNGAAEASENPDGVPQGEGDTGNPFAQPDFFSNSGENPQQAGNPENPGSPEGSSAGSDDPDTGANPNEQEPTNAEDRIKYWQSKADRVEAEQRKLREQYEAQQPILKYINENPHLASKVYNVVQEELGGSSEDVPSNGVATAQAPQKPQRPQRPEKPEKPEGFSMQDAFNDPQSESAAYQEKMVEYQEQLAQYNEDLSSYREQVEQQRQAMTQKQQQAMRIRQEAYNEAVYRYGMNPTEAQDFVSWASNPQVDMKDLIGIFRSRSQRANGQNPTSQAIQNRNDRLNNPAPPVTQGNQGNPNAPKDGEEPDFGTNFVESIKAFSGQ